jgi:hypothetical protein
MKLIPDQLRIKTQKDSFQLSIDDQRNMLYSLGYDLNSGLTVIDVFDLGVLGDVCQLVGTLH